MLDLIPVYNPEILLVFSIVAVIPIKDGTMNKLQRMICLYLLLATINFFLNRHFILPLTNISLNLSILPLLAVLLFFILFKKYKKICLKSVPSGTILAVSLIVFFIALLFIALKLNYGYGYEANYKILKNLVYNLVLIIFAWPMLEIKQFRLPLNIILIALMAFITISERLL